MLKKFYGGIFIIADFLVCVFFSFAGLIFSFEQTPGSVLGIWVFLLCSLTVYIFIKHAVVSQDFSLIAGYDPDKDDKEELSKMLQALLIYNSFFALVYSMLYTIRSFLEENKQETFSIIITLTYVISLILLICILNKKYNYRQVRQLLRRNRHEN